MSIAIDQSSALNGLYQNKTVLYMNLGVDVASQFRMRHKPSLKSNEMSKFTEQI